MAFTDFINGVKEIANAGVEGIKSYQTIDQQLTSQKNNAKSAKQQAAADAVLAQQNQVNVKTYILYGVGGLVVVLLVVWLVRRR